MEMIDENKIDSYLRFYNAVSESLKPLKPRQYSIDWAILEKHKDFVESLKSKVLILDYEVRRVQEELDKFVKELTSLPLTQIVNYSLNYNSEINLGEKTKINFNDRNEVLAHLAVDLIFPSYQQSTVSRDIKRHLKNTYYSLATVKKCLSDGGLLLDDIKRRANYTFYNFVLIDKTEVRKKTYHHYYITKVELDNYVQLYNAEKDMRIDGKFFAYSPKTEITITATKFKNEEEIDRYKSHKRLYNDKPFLSSDMCVKITSQFISAKVSEKLTKPVKSIRDLIKASKIKEAMELGLKEKDISKDDDDFLTLLLSRLNKIEVDNKKGVANDYKTEFNKITDALISKIKEWGI
jgi:Effector-associated domain 11